MRMKHLNVLSIEGVAPELFEFCMVSRWMENGRISDYVKKYVGVNRLELVGLRGDLMIRRFESVLMESQLIGVTRGLSYLHGNGVIHGDLKSVIVLSPGLSQTLYG